MAATRARSGSAGRAGRSCAAPCAAGRSARCPGWRPAARPITADSRMVSASENCPCQPKKCSDTRREFWAMKITSRIRNSAVPIRPTQTPLTLVGPDPAPVVEARCRGCARPRLGCRCGSDSAAAGEHRRRSVGGRAGGAMPSGDRRRRGGRSAAGSDRSSAVTPRCVRTGQLLGVGDRLTATVRDWTSGATGRPRYRPAAVVSAPTGGWHPAARSAGAGPGAPAAAPRPGGSRPSAWRAWLSVNGWGSPASTRTACSAASAATTRSGASRSN